MEIDAWVLPRRTLSELCNPDLMNVFSRAYIMPVYQERKRITDSGVRQAERTVRYHLCFGGVAWI
jgi:hypothetical protein